MGRGGRQLRVVEGDAEREEATKGETTKDEAWQRAMATGDRAALLPEVVRAILAEAGREGRLHVEIGALRVVVERLLAEVADAERLATLLPRVTNAIIRALQVQRALGAGEDEELAQLVARIMAAADAEQAARRGE